MNEGVALEASLPSMLIIVRAQARKSEFLLGECVNHGVGTIQGNVIVHRIFLLLRGSLHRGN